MQPVAQQAETVPDVLPEILLLAGDPDPNGPSFLANGLWIKYRTSMDWAWKVWDNTVASLRQIPSMTNDMEARRACAMRYGTFLWRVDQHLPKGLDQDVLRWFLGPGQAEVLALSVEAWDVLKVVLLFLAVHGALKSTTILQGLVYPAWKLGVIGSVTQPVVTETYLSAANSLCFDLLLQEDVHNDSVPPTDLFELQSIRTRRQAVYDEPHFPLLVSSIPTLISLENNDDISDAKRSESTALRCRLCQQSGFRRGAYRNLEIIREAFENSPYLMDEDPSSEHLSKRAIAGLRIILCDSTDGKHFQITFQLCKINRALETNIYDWPEVNCLLTPWKIAATTIQMQLQVKQLGRALSHESTSESATANLNKLTSMLFHHTKTAEEAYYVGEMARGADSTVATKFLNNGLQSIIELFESPDSDPGGQNLYCLRRAGELLRVLIHVSQPFRDMPIQLSVDTTIHETFVSHLESKLKIVEKEILNDEMKPQSRENLISLTRLLQFILSFKNSWTPRIKETYISISNLLFYFVLVSPKTATANLCVLTTPQHFANEDNFEEKLYPMMIDTLLVLYDGKWL